jgi:hypothetical protein
MSPDFTFSSGFPTEKLDYNFYLFYNQEIPHVSAIKTILGEAY